MKTMRTSAAARRGRIRGAWIPLVLVASGLAALGSPAQGQSPSDVLYYSHRFAVDLSSPGASRLVVLGSEGTEEQSVVLAPDQLPIIGPGEFYGLLGGGPGAAGRAFEVYGATGDLRGRFSIPGDRAPAVGTGALLLQPRADHQPTRPFQIQFLTLAGAAIASYARPDLILVSVEPLESGYWLLTSERTAGGWHLHLFGEDGALRWQGPSPGTNPPLVSVSPDGSRTAVSVMRDDLTMSDLRLLGLQGGVISTRAVIPFQHASFNSDAQYLVLAGNGQVELLAGSDGASLWQGAEALRVAAGEAVGFSALGSRFFVLGQAVAADGTPGPARLATYTIAGPAVTRQEQPLDIVPGARLTVTDLDELPDGRLRVVTDRGVWSLTP